MNYANIIDTISDKYPYISFIILCIVLIIIGLITRYGFNYRST
jgi:hypothetical protein